MREAYSALHISSRGSSGWHVAKLSALLFSFEATA
jgi:hypothetical protein